MRVHLLRWLARHERLPTSCWCTVAEAYFVFSYMFYVSKSFSISQLHVLRACHMVKKALGVSAAKRLQRTILSDTSVKTLGRAAAFFFIWNPWRAVLFFFFFFSSKKFAGLPHYTPDPWTSNFLWNPQASKYVSFFFKFFLRKNSLSFYQIH